MSLRTLTVAACLMIAPLPAMAQEPEPPIASAPIEMVAGLAEVLGRAHAVRTVCNGDTDSTWRNYMLNLMAIEAPSGSRRAALTAVHERACDDFGGAAGHRVWRDPSRPLLRDQSHGGDQQGRTQPPLQCRPQPP